MDRLIQLLTFIELTRSQVQSGYALAGISKHDLSDLASHHYLVTFIAWQLARHVKNKGGKINIEKVLEFGLVHDLGELLGGDIAMPYARLNPKARSLAKAFEAENQRFILQLFGDDQAYFKQLMTEIMDATSDEALIAKLADYIEVTQYKAYIKTLTAGDMKLAKESIAAKLAKISDPVTKRALKKITTAWLKVVPKMTFSEILQSLK